MTVLGLLGRLSYGVEVSNSYATTRGAVLSSHGFFDKRKLTDFPRLEQTPHKLIFIKMAANIFTPRAYIVSQGVRNRAASLSRPFTAKLSKQSPRAAQFTPARY